MLVEIKEINKEEVIVVSSLDVAETFTYYSEEEQRYYVREHKAVLRAIRELKCSEEFRGEHFTPSNYTDTRGKSQPCMLMDRDGFSMLVMGFEDPRSIVYKEGYIKQFNAMEKALKEILEERHRTEMERAKGIAVRQALTKAIQQSGENDRMHGHAYSAYTDVIYKSIFGKNAKQLREENGITKKENLRDCFSKEEISEIQNAEMLVSSLVGYGWGYDDIKEFLLNKALKRIAA